jgi:hypothetical protein
MSELLGYSVDSVTAYAVMLLIPEFTTLVIFEHDAAGWKLRVGNNLLIKRWKVAISIFAVLILLFFIEENISQLIQNLIGNLKYRELLVPSSLIITFVWIWHFIVGMNLNKTMGILLLIATLLIGFFISFNIGIF